MSRQGTKRSREMGGYSKKLGPMGLYDAPIKKTVSSSSKIANKGGSQMLGEKSCAWRGVPRGSPDLVRP